MRITIPDLILQDRGYQQCPWYQIITHFYEIIMLIGSHTLLNIFVEDHLQTNLLCGFMHPIIEIQLNLIKRQPKIANKGPYTPFH